MDTHDSHHAYKYRPLESLTTVRVLVLQPAQDLNDPLKANLVHLENESPFLASSEPDSYEAISYCWGESTLSHTILIDGESLLGITDSVNTLLRYLRSKSKFRHFWLDAICLNQGDRHEKEVQVRRMGKIYAQASKVRVWIGTATEQQNIPQLFNAFKWLATRSKMKNNPTKDEAEKVFGTCCGLNWSATIYHFFSRPYFQRRWILQEIAFGDDIVIHCGNWKISWQWFGRGVQRLKANVGRDLGVQQDIHNVMEVILAIQSMRECTLEMLLWIFDWSQCSMPQDKIFALLGLANDTKWLPDVDYAKHWAQIFTEIAGTYFPPSQATMWFHLASFGSLREISSQDFRYPSWVPNWNNNRNGINIMPDDSQSFSVSSSFKQDNFRYSPTQRTIEFDGLYRGRIENISASWKRPFSDPIHAKYPIWNEETISSMSEALLCLFLTPFGRPTERFKQFRLSDELSPTDTMRTLLEIIREVGPWNYNSTAQLHQQYHAAVSSMLETLWSEHDIVLVHGKRKAIGIGPRSIQSGDILLLLPFPTSYILSRKLGIIVRTASGDSQRPGYAQKAVYPGRTLHSYQYIGPCSFVPFGLKEEGTSIAEDHYSVHVELV